MIDEWWWRVTIARLTPPHDQDEAHQKRERDRAAQAYEVHRNGAVAADGRVVVVAVEQQLVDDRADAPLPRLHQRHPQLLRRVLHAVEIARETAVGRGHEQAAGVRELLRLLVPAIREPRRR